MSHRFSATSLPARRGIPLVCPLAIRIGHPFATPFQPPFSPPTLAELLYGYVYTCVHGTYTSGRNGRVSIARVLNARATRCDDSAARGCQCGVSPIMCTIIQCYMARRPPHTGRNLVPTAFGLPLVDSVFLFSFFSTRSLSLIVSEAAICIPREGRDKPKGPSPPSFRSR